MRYQICMLTLLFVICVYFLQMYSDAHVKRAAIFAGLCNLTASHEEFAKASAAKPDHADVFIQRARVNRETCCMYYINVLLHACIVHNVHTKCNKLNTV